MQTYLDCFPCLLRQALEAARMAGGTHLEQERVIESTLERLRGFDRTSSPPVMAYAIHQLVSSVTGNADPYAKVKRQSTERALTMYATLKTLAAQADDPLLQAVRLSIAGNIIDFGVSQEYDLEESIRRALSRPFAIDAFAAFRSVLEHCNSVLYLADNAGETVFDRVLIEELSRPVIYVVKSRPILNDATRDDALAAGLGKLTTIVDSGSGAPGTVLEDCSVHFRSLLGQADLVIAKGQANYETLGSQGPGCFFLLQVKCPVIARDLGVPANSIVLKQGHP